MTFRRLIRYLGLVVQTIFVTPFQLLRYRGFFLETVAQEAPVLTREPALKALAWRCGIEKVNPFDAFPGLEGQLVLLSRGHWSSMHDLVEYPVLSGIVALHQPEKIFEFGTFEGEATLMFARLCPEAQITTVDLPPADGDGDGGGWLPKEKMGWQFRDQPESERIEQILADSRQLDTSGREESYDFVWVDAGHSYENVKNDTEKAFVLAKEGALVCWHDFDVYESGVTRFLSEFSRRQKLSWIERTSIVFARKGG